MHMLRFARARPNFMKAAAVIAEFREHGGVRLMSLFVPARSLEDGVPSQKAVRR
jgi:hypothetical protein